MPSTLYFESLSLNMSSPLQLANSSPGTCLSRPVPALGLWVNTTIHGFYLDAGDLNSGHRTYGSPSHFHQPTSFFFISLLLTYRFKIHSFTFLQITQNISMIDSSGLATSLVHVKKNPHEHDFQSGKDKIQAAISRACQHAVSE